MWGVISKFGAKLQKIMEKKARNVRNISYFCIVKHLYRHISKDLRNFIALSAVMFFSVIGPAYSQPTGQQTGFSPDSLHIYLLTCSPHQEVYSLYGHTAIRMENRNNGTDYAINYGVFDFRKPFFVLRFVFGLTDYEMGIYETSIFKDEYRYYGSGVTQQEINLTPEEKMKFFAAVDENYKPENRVYRYNYFYDNCTTRARDIIVNSINGKVAYGTTPPTGGTTFRRMIHKMNEGHPWARLGNDLLLGIGADRELSAEDMQFLPHSMYDAAKSAYIIDNKGHKRSFVKQESELVSEGTQVVEEEFPLTPVQCAVILLALSIIASVYEWKRGRYLWWFDAGMMFAQTLCGLILTAMIFSQHPTVSLNIQILLFNILPLFFGVPAIRQYRRGQVHFLWLIQAVLICLMLVLSSSGVQWTGMEVRLVALCVLLRATMKFKLQQMRR